MDDLLLSEVQIIEKLIVNKQENTLGLYCQVYFRKTQGIEKDWIKSLKRRYAGISIGHFLPAKNGINFYSNQGLDF